MGKVKEGVKEVVNPADVTVSGEDMVTGIKEVKEEEVTSILSSLTLNQKIALQSTFTRKGRVSVQFGKYADEILLPLQKAGLVTVNWRYDEETRQTALESTIEVREKLKKVDWDNPIDLGMLQNFLWNTHLKSFSAFKTAYWLTDKGKIVADQLYKEYKVGLEGQLSKWEKDSTEEDEE